MQINVDGTPILVSDDISTTARQLQVQTDNAMTTSQNLRTYLDGFAEAWQFSHAAAKYEELRADWDLAARNLFGDGGLLDTIIRALDTSYQNYLNAEHSNIATWQHQ